MILVDSSIWIDVLRKRPTEEVERLREYSRKALLATPDLVIAEVLQGAMSDRQFVAYQQQLLAFPVIIVSDYRIAVSAARYYRQLRALGITVRGTIDCLLATRCIADGHSLLARDRDFLPFAHHFGLKLA